MKDKLHVIMPIFAVFIITACCYLNRTNIKEKFSKNPVVSISAMVLTVIVVFLIIHFVSIAILK